MDLLAQALEIVRVLAVAARVERARTSVGPQPLLSSLRAEGGQKAARSPAARARLARAVRVVERCFPGGPNCYRRVLLEVALDAGAARQAVRFGLMAGGGPGSGHAYFQGDEAGRQEATAQRFDVVFEL
jgi:hypothetical protein